MSEWQPIETAPKSDDDVLLGFPNGDTCIAYWRDDAKAWDSTSEGWITARPTHWMSIPDLPTVEPKEQQ